MRYLLLGSSAASIAAASVLRQECPQDEIIMASADERVYSRCMLHQYLSNKRDIESLNFTQPDFFTQNNIQWLPNSSALSLDLNAQDVHFKDCKISYDKLLIATGASGFVPNIPNLRGAGNVYRFLRQNAGTAVRVGSLRKRRGTAGKCTNGQTEKT